MADSIQHIAPAASKKNKKEREIWKPVLSEPGVLASSLGRILLPPRHAPLKNGGYRIYTPKPTFGISAKSQKHAAHTYRHVMVWRGDHRRQAPRKVHQLVCEAFHGEKPFLDAVVVHRDENAHNNRPENLKWGTQKENLNMPKYRQHLRDRALAQKAHKLAPCM